MNAKIVNKPPGRPRRRTEEIRLRVTPEEKRKIKSLAKLAKLTVTKLITISVIHGQNTHIQQVDPKLIEHLLRIGNNLNQIARRCNSHAKVGQAINVLHVLMELRAIRQTLHSYVAPT